MSKKIVLEQRRHSAIVLEISETMFLECKPVGDESLSSCAWFHFAKLAPSFWRSNNEFTAKRYMGRVTHSAFMPTPLSWRED